MAMEAPLSHGWKKETVIGIFMRKRSIRLETLSGVIVHSGGAIQIANADIYAQKIDSAGDTQWDNNGTVLCNEDTDDQYTPEICCDGDGGAISKKLQSIPLRNENKHETKSTSISLDEFKKKLFEEQISKRTYPRLTPKAVKTICIPPAMEKKEEIRFETTHTPFINRGKQPFNLEKSDFLNDLENEIVDTNESEVFMTQKHNKNEIIPIRQGKELQKIIFNYGESLKLGILAIYYICKIFPKNSKIDKIFFSGSELNFILEKHAQFFYKVNDRLENNNLIKFYGTVTRKEKSNEKIYLITEKGVKFSREIIEVRRQDFPTLFDEFITTLEEKYTEYNKELIDSEKRIIIRSQEEINYELRKITEDNNIELVTTYISDHIDIEFRCNKCKKQFKETYQLIKSRKDPILFCPLCFPELKRNMYLSEELRIQISKYVYAELIKITLHTLSKNEILDIKEFIKESIYSLIELQIIEKNPEFKEFILKYICSIIGFLTEVKRLYETNQFINLSEISLLFHDKSIVSESMWQDVCRAIIDYLRYEFDFNIRSKRYDWLQESTRQSIRYYKNLLKLIDDRTIIYLDIDYTTEINIYYNAKCQGISGYCPFDIDYKFLPALSYDHRLENYNAIIRREGYGYIAPKKMLGGSFNEALAKMKSQIGGMDLRCRNCHASRHHKMYYFIPIFNYLKSLYIKNIDENTTFILERVKILAEQYFEHTKNNIKLTEKYTQASVLSRIRSQILRLVKKKYAVEYLFGKDYICPICKKTNANDNLDCFEAHHTNEALFEHGLQKIEFSLYYFKSTEWIIKNLIAQECIYVCRNCHTMITAINYNENALIILKNEIDALHVNNYYDNLYKKVSEKRNIILQWKSQLKNNTNSIPNPFLKMFEYGESIFSALICIYYICEIFSQHTKKDFFTAEELNYIQEKSSSYFKEYKNNLINLEYIQYKKRLLEYRGFRFNKDIYRITFDGILKAKEIIEEKLVDFQDEFNELISIWEQRSKDFNEKFK